MTAFCSVITTGRSIKIGCLSIKSPTRLGVSSFSGIAIFRKSSSFFLQACRRAHPVIQLTGLFLLFRADYLGTPPNKILSVRFGAAQRPLWISSMTDCEKILAISSFQHRS